MEHQHLWAFDRVSPGLGAIGERVTVERPDASSCKRVAAETEAMTVSEGIPTSIFSANPVRRSGSTKNSAAASERAP
jgi:hypothetical protein